MIKKIIITLILSCFIISCGKKGDPFYKDSTKIILKESVYLKQA